MDLSRKLCLIIISVFFMPGSSTQLVALFVYTITYFFFLFWKWPYLAFSDNVYVRPLIVVHSAHVNPQNVTLVCAFDQAMLAQGCLGALLLMTLLLRLDAVRLVFSPYSSGRDATLINNILRRLRWTITTRTFSAC